MEYELVDQEKRRRRTTINAADIWQKVRIGIGLDVRSLAFFRVFLGLLLMWDMIDRWPMIQAWYSDEGIVNRKVLMEQFWNNEFISVHVANGTVFFGQLVFAFHIISAFCLMIGYRSTLNTVIQWYMHISLQIRNPIVLHNGDVYIRLVLFFCMFLPLGERFSVDCWRRQKTKQRGFGPPLVADFTSVALIIQIMTVYIASWIHKRHNAYHVWFEASVATYYALNLDYYRRPFGDFLLWLGMPVIKMMNFTVLWWELWGYVFWMSPVFHTFFRIIGVLGTIALHAGFGAAIRLETFYLTGMTATLGCLPAFVWDTFVPAVFRRLDTTRAASRRFCSPKKVFYDPVRGAGLARFVEVFCLLFNVEIRPFYTPSNSEQYLESGTIHQHHHHNDSNPSTPNGDTPALAVTYGLNNNINSSNNVYSASASSHHNNKLIAFVDEGTGKTTEDFDALRAIFYASPVLPVFWPVYWLMRFAFVRTVGDYLLDSISESSPIPSTHSGGASRNGVARRKQRRSRFRRKVFIRNACAAFFMIFCIMWNGGNLGYNSFPQSLKWIAMPTLLYQMWNMFCPPPTYTWYHTIEGTLRNNQTMDLMRDYGLQKFEGQPWSGPIVENEQLPEIYPNNRWHKMFEGLSYGKPWNRALTIELGRYVCREWNKRHVGGEVLQKHRIWMMVQMTRLDGTRGPVTKEIMHDHSCF